MGKIQKKKLTSTVGGRRSGDFAGSGEGGGLGDVQNDAELSAALEGLAEAGSVSFEDGLEAAAASPCGLCIGAPIGHKGQAVRHVQDQGRAVHRRRRSRVV